MLKFEKKTSVKIEFKIFYTVEGIEIWAWFMKIGKQFVKSVWISKDIGLTLIREI